MAGYAELNRLKTAQDLAFQHKQNAHNVQQRAREKRMAACDAMNRAHDSKQSAYSNQNDAWQRYQSLRKTNGPRIDSLNAKQEQAFQNMKSAFDNASSAHDRRDGAAVASYAADGHRHKVEAQMYVADRRKLVDEIRSSRAQHDANKLAFQRAKDDFDTTKRSFNSAKAEHERMQAEFKHAKVDFDSCVKVFKARLEQVKTEGNKRRENKRLIAARAGVPHQYHENLWVSTDSNGNTNIYFGGIGKPNGPGHGHYVMDINNKVTTSVILMTSTARRTSRKQIYTYAVLVGITNHSGLTSMGVYRRSDSGGTILHVTQYFADNYHVSWDATPYGNSIMCIGRTRMFPVDILIVSWHRPTHASPKRKGAIPLRPLVLGGFRYIIMVMKQDEQAILACDMIQMIRENANNYQILQYLEGFAFSLARGLEDVSVVSWDDIAGTCDQRYYSLKVNNPVPLNSELLNRCEQSLQAYLPK